MSDNNITCQPLAWTGERYLPEVHGNIEVEHLHRYLFARQFSLGKKVLDIASGEGYGSAMLAQNAVNVIGVDIAAQAVAHAAAKYQANNLEFKTGSCSAIPLEDHSVDIVVSFETIEHHNEHVAMMCEIKRVLMPGGLLIISSPDKFEYSDRPGTSNQHHVKELYLGEFENLLGNYFKHHAIAGQRVVYGSAIFNGDDVSKVRNYDLNDTTLQASLGIPRALYLIAIASDGELPLIESGILEQPISENDVVREYTWQNAHLTQIVTERDGQINDLKQVVVQRDGQINDLKQTVADRYGQVTILESIQQEQHNKIIQTHRAITRNLFIKLGSSLDRLTYRRRGEYYRLWRAVKSQPLFDTEWYARQNIDAQLSKITPLYHYYFFGADEGRNPNPYFDTLWYLKEYPDVARSGINPLLHYLKHGAAEGRNPSSYFDTRWYLEEYPDVPLNDVNPLLHYLNQGIKERRSPNPHFDTRWYLAEYPDVANSGMDPLLHYLQYGAGEGKNPNPYFDTQWYLTEYSDVSRCGMNPLLHYLRHGIKEGRNPNPFFDSRWYLAEYPEVASIGIDPLLHYLKFGVEEGKNPNPYFDTQWYLSEYPEVVNIGMNPLLHYMKHGVEGGKNPSSYFDACWYLTEYPDVANIGMDPLHHFLSYGVKEGRKTAFKAVIPGYELAREGRPSADFFMLHSHAISSELLNFDLVLVTYNSAKWIDNCLNSLLPHDKNITITIVDNCSEDDTVERLERYQSRFSSFKIIKSDSNLGFGAANNLGAQSNTNHYLLFLNIDTELQDTKSFSKLSKIITASKAEVVAWELRQLPYEHPKCYDPISLEISWFSCAAVVIRRDAFEEIGGFDEKLFMYCEDVDLSWRLRARGYRLLYCPSVTITHYSYSKPGEVKPVAQLFGVKHNFFLRKRYGTALDIKEGKELLEEYSRAGKKNIPLSLWEKLADTEKESEYFKLTRCESNQFFQPFFDGFNYEIVREGGFFASRIAQQSEKVSVIVRTTGRLNYLEKAIYSIINQTYQNIEIVIVEDGSNKAQELVSSFKDFNIVYHASEKVGRCRAGNIGLDLATGSYCNFLDEDDLLYCDHIETLINAISERSDYGAVWSSAFCVKTEEMADRQSYNERTYIMAHTVEPDKDSILNINYFPIQAVLFRRECYEKLGGFDPEMDLLEDWELWIKYLQQYKFIRVDKTTSLYRVPFQKDISEERKKSLDEYYKRVRMKYR